MPVRGLDFYINNNNNNNLTPNNSLSNKRIAIDASFYIKKLLLKINEPFIAATGGIPLSYKQTLKHHLNHLTITLNITPFFVFNGIFWKKEKPFTYEDKRPQMRVLGWQEVKNGDYLKAAGFLGGGGGAASGGVGVYDLYQATMDVLDEVCVEWIRAPYLAVAQISVMEEYFHGVYAGSEYLMFGSISSVLITSIDDGIGVSGGGGGGGSGVSGMRSVRKLDILNWMGLSTDQQFLDVCCLAGFDYASTCAELSRGFSFERVVEYVKAGNVPADKESFERTKLMVTCHPVIGGDGKVRLMSDNYSLVDMRDIFGVRLPDYVYYSLSRGRINSQLLQTVITGYQVETYPLISGERYVEFVKSDLLLGLKSGVYELLGDILPFKPQIEVYYYFDSQVGYPLVISDTGGRTAEDSRRNDIRALLSKKEEEVDEVVIILRELVKEENNTVFKDVISFEEIVCRIGCFVAYDEVLLEYLDIDLLEFVCVVRNIERNLRNYLEIFQLLTGEGGGNSRLFTREYSTHGGIVMRKYFSGGKVSEKEMRHVRRVVGVCERVAESVKEIVGLDVKKLSKIK